MNPFELPTNNASSDWLIFVAILLAVGIGIASSSGFSCFGNLARNATSAIVVIIAKSIRRSPRPAVCRPNASLTNRRAEFNHAA